MSPKVIWGHLKWKIHDKMSNFDLDRGQIIYRKDTLEVSFPRKLISWSIKVIPGQKFRKGRILITNSNQQPWAKREANGISANLPTRAKREAEGILVNLSPRAKREAEGILHWRIYEITYSITLKFYQKVFFNKNLETKITKGMGHSE